MRSLMIGAAAAALLGSAFAAQSQPLRMRVYGPPPGLTADEIRDYRMDQLERRQEIQRERLEMRQRVERRMVDPDDDDID